MSLPDPAIDIASRRRATPQLAAPPASAARSRSYTAGLSDGLGDRQLAFDPAVGTSIEVLQLKEEFGDSVEFEAALRGRVEDVKPLHHPSLATIHAVERVEGQGLTVVSKHIQGRRLSELVQKAHGPTYALELLRLVTPALATLHRAENGLAHGILTAEKIIATRDGRLIVVEHAFGSAIEALNLSRQRLHELGVVVPEGTGPVKFDGRTDMAQLGFIALSLLLGRRLDPADYPSKVPALLDEFVQTPGSLVLAARMRVWLERAMQISARSFSSAREAHDSLSQLPDDATVKAAESMRTMTAVPADVSTTPATSQKPRQPQPFHTGDGAVARHDAEPIASEPAPVSSGRRRGLSRPAIWVIALLSLVAAGEAVVFFVLPYARPATDVIEIRSPQLQADRAAVPVALPAPPPAFQPVVDPAAAQAAPIPVSTNADPLAAAASATAPAATTVPAGPRFGGMTVTSTIELQVFKNGALVGSTAAPIAVNEGSHTLEFVNDTLGFRYRQVVNVRGGQMTSVKIAAPNGRININAVPWAEVTIDGTPAGETPIANLSLPIGPHEIVFRHPQFGERKQTVIVRADGIARATQTFQQPPR